jgi:hypothetical protein
MKGLASLFNYQAGGPIGYATGGEIAQIYQDLFGRAPDAGGLQYWSSTLSGVPLSTAYATIAGSARGSDATTVQNNPNVLADRIVESIYREQLGRPADAGGKEYYTNQIKSGRSVHEVAKEIDRSLEGYNYDAEKLASIYRQEFGRNPEQQGFQYWMSMEDSLVGQVNKNNLTNIIKTGAQGSDISAIAAQPAGGYSNLNLSALGADPYAGRYATVNPYYYGELPSDAVNVSRTLLNHYIQYTSPVYEQPVVSWFDQGNQFNAKLGNNVLQRADVENAINLALTSGALDQKTATDLRDKINPNSKNKVTSWGELYDTLRAPEAKVVLDAMGVQVGEDVSADRALQEANARKELANITATSIGGYPSAFYQFEVAQNLAGKTGKNINDIYPFSPQNLGLGSINTKKTIADVYKNLGTELGFRPDEKIVRIPQTWQEATTPTAFPSRPVSTPNTSTNAPAGIAALRGPMAMPELLVQPTARPRLDFMPRTLDLATQEFGGVRGIPQSVFAMPQTAIAARQSAVPVEAAPAQMALPEEAVLGETIVPEEAAPVEMAKGGMPRLSAREAGSKFDISEYIDPETGMFYINEYQRDVLFNPELREAERRERERERERMRGMARGGLASIAENLAEKGRGGDTMLVHMAPEELQGLRGLAMHMGSDLTINPQTGLPEAKLLKKLLPILPFIPGIGQILGPIAASMGSFGAALSSFAAASPVLAKSIASGIIGGFTAPGKGFNFKEGLKTGAKAFAMAKGLEGLQAAGQMGAPSGGTADMSSLTGTGGSLDAAKVETFLTGSPPPERLLSETGAQLVPPSTVPSEGMIGSETGARLPYVTAPTPSSPPAYVGAGTTGVNALPPSTGPDISVKGFEDAARGVKNIFTGGPEASAAFESGAGVKPMTAAYLGVSGYGMLEGEKERQAFKAAEAAKANEEEERRRQYAALFRRTLGQVPMAAGGGMVAFADGGMPAFEYGGTTAPTGEPRMVKGAGDGMSDNVPANIEGVQEARLANDEFVIPADVVADIGNGSSSAGAKKLYAMMDRIRQARHGTTEQPPEIKAERLLPA